MVDVKKFLFLFSSPKILVVTQQQKYLKDIVYHVTKTQFLTLLSTIIIPERGRRLLVFVNLSITLLFCGTLASNWPRSVEKLILTHFLGEIAGKSVFFKPLHEEDRHYGRMVQGFEFKSGFLSSSPSCYHWIGFFSVLQISIPSLWCVNSTMVWPPPQWFLANDMFFNLSFIKLISSSAKNAEVLNMSIPPNRYWPPRFLAFFFYHSCF